jgi:hypothetical protein
MDSDEASLIAVISEESALMADELERFEFAIRYPALPTCRQTVAKELREAQAAVASRTEWTYKGSSISQSATAVAPDGALRQLFEAVFRVHSHHAGRGTITCECDPVPERLRVQIVSESVESDIIKPTYWTTYLRHLSGLIGVTIEELAHPCDQNTVTSLTVAISQEKP